MKHADLSGQGQVNTKHADISGQLNRMKLTAPPPGKKTGYSSPKPPTAKKKPAKKADAKADARTCYFWGRVAPPPTHTHTHTHQLVLRGGWRTSCV